MGVGCMGWGVGMIRFGLSLDVWRVCVCVVAYLEGVVEEVGRAAQHLCVCFHVSSPTQG